MKIQEMFLAITNMSLVASFIIAVVILARILLKKFPKIFSYILWIPVLFKLLIPFSFEGLFSLIPINEKSIPTKIDYSSAVNINTGITRVDNSVNSMITKTPEVSAPVERITREVATNPMETALKIITIIWIIGIVFMVARAIYGYIKLNKKLVGSIKYRDNIYLCDYIDTPFVVGIIKPKIYLPSSIEICDYIILHEEIHIRRRDNIIKIFAYLALTLHWFNPLVWIAFILSTNDMEMSCDEAVVREINNINADYAESLLKISTGRRKINAVSINFGEENTKERVKNIMKYKKSKWWKILLGVVLSVVVLVGCLGGKKNDKFELDNIINRNISINQESFKNPEVFYCDGKKILIYLKDFGILEYDMEKSEIINRVKYEDAIADIKIKGYISAYTSNLTDETLYFYDFVENQEEWDILKYNIETNKFEKSNKEEADRLSYNKDSDYEASIIWSEDKLKLKEMELLLQERNKDTSTIYKIFGDSTDTKPFDRYVNFKGKKKLSEKLDLSDINEMMIFGSQFPEIIFADENKVVMENGFGIIEYDLNEKEISRRLSFGEIKKILPVDTQWFMAKASNDGSKVYFGKDMLDLWGMENKLSYAYNLEENTVESLEKEPTDIFEHFVYYDHDKSFGLGNGPLSGMVEVNNKLFFLDIPNAAKPSELVLIVRDLKTNKEKSYKIFKGIEVKDYPTETDSK